VQQLVGAVARTWQPDAERVQVRVRIGPGITHADLDTAVPGGLIVTELVTNAFKHAFPGDRRGALTVSLSLTNDGRRRLEVTDDGVGPGAAPDRRPDQERLGLTLVRSLVYQLHGEMAILPGEPGTRVVIEFPATRC
jgi:two-component sensor histidine kinase